MMRSVLVVAIASVVAVSAAGCRKQQAPATAADLTPSPAPERVAAAPPPATPEPAPVDPWSGDLESINAYIAAHGLLDDVYFDYDRAELRQDARESLAKNNRFLHEHPEFVVAIEGHCDERGTTDYNLALGQSRAGSAKDYLSQLGSDPTKLQTISYGKERPVCIDPSEQCWWRNRRARFVVVGRTG